MRGVANQAAQGALHHRVEGWQTGTEPLAKQGKTAATLGIDSAVYVPESVRALAAKLHEHGFRAWAVGGAVRDSLMQRATADWDIASEAAPQDVQRIFRRVIPTGIQHGTVSVLWRGGCFEVTALRGDGAYRDGRRPETVTYVKTIEEDLARRDFTVNALAVDLVEGTLIDPFGGLRDLQARTLRAVGEADRRFAEDGLRALRGARFAATLEFVLEDATLHAMGRHVATFRKVSVERVRTEMAKLLAARRPSLGLNVMAQTGLADVVFAPIELSPSVRFASGRELSRWQQAMAVVDGCPPDWLLRLAALLSLSEACMDSAGFAGVWMRRFRLSKEQQRIVELLLSSQRSLADVCSPAAARRWLHRFAHCGLLDWAGAALDLGEAAARAWLNPERRGLEVFCAARQLVEHERLLRRPLVVADLAVSGRDLIAALGRGPGPWVGQGLHRLLDIVLDQPELNSRDRLLEWSRHNLAL